MSTPSPSTDVKGVRNVLVTGCSGYLGSHLADALVQEGYSVVGVDRCPPRYPNAVATERIRFFQLELADPGAAAALAKRLEGIHAVLHTAAHQPYTWDPAPFVFGNVSSTATVLEAMRLAGTPRLVHSSTSALYGGADQPLMTETDPVRPRNIYEITKLQGEQLAQFYSETYGIQTLSMRYASLYGGRNRDGSLYYFLDRTLKGEPIRLFAKGKTLRDYVCVHDVVRVNIAALTAPADTPFEAFNIGGGRVLSTGDLVQAIFRASGRSTEIVYAEDPRWNAAGFCLDISKARRMLGFAPTPIEQGITEYLRVLAAPESVS
jgi:nucleoside-diphosphate-sugar epimerase